MKRTKHVMTAEEWDSLPITFGTEEAARAFSCTVRYAQAHAEELGGKRIAGRWVFAKPNVAVMLGLEI